MFTNNLQAFATSGSKKSPRLLFSNSPPTPEDTYSFTGVKNGYDSFIEEDVDITTVLFPEKILSLQKIA